MSKKSKTNRESLERSRQPKNRSAELRRLSRYSGISLIELETIRRVFPPFYRFIKREAA